MLCLLAIANGYMSYPCAVCYRITHSNACTVQRGQMSIEIREMQLADIPEAAELLSRTFEPPDGYNVIQSAIVFKETVTGLTERLNQAHAIHTATRATHYITLCVLP